LLSPLSAGGENSKKVQEISLDLFGKPPKNPQIAHPKISTFLPLQVINKKARDFSGFFNLKGLQSLSK
jgi:hypothetical protein